MDSMPSLRKSWNLATNVPSARSAYACLTCFLLWHAYAVAFGCRAEQRYVVREVYLSQHQLSP